MTDIASEGPRPGEKRKLRRSERLQSAAKRQRTVDSDQAEITFTKKPKHSGLVKVIEIVTPPPTSPFTPRSQRALTVARKGEYLVVEDHPLTSLHHDDEIMIKGHSVGLNPIDFKSVIFNFCLPDFPWVTGREMAGTVESVGKNVSHVRPGDRVWTSTYYKDVRAGCFQEYVIVPQHTVLPIPPEISFEQASCLGVAGLTAAMTLWKWMKIPMPHVSADGQLSPPQTPEGSQGEAERLFGPTQDVRKWILIWGGSTITGQFTTQLAKLSNLKAITICSAKTATLSKSLGADHVIARDSLSRSRILTEIAAVTKGHIAYAIDIVGEDTAASCLEACSTDLQQEVLGSRKVPFAPLAFMKKDQVVPDNIQVENVEMKRFILDKASNVYALQLNRLLETGRLRLPPLEVLEGGLSAIPEALERLRKGDMGGHKLIVKV